MLCKKCGNEYEECSLCRMDERHQQCLDDRECNKCPHPEQAEASSLSDLLSAKDLAIASLGKLQNEFEKLNIYTYAEMMEGLIKTVDGAVIIAKQARNL